MDISDLAVVPNSRQQVACPPRTHVSSAYLFAGIPRAFAKGVRWQGLLAAEWLLAHSPVGVVLPSTWHVL